MYNAATDMSTVPTIGSPLRRLRVFIASPKDVAEERAAVHGIIDEINTLVAFKQGIMLVPFLWEVDAPPRADQPQRVINRYLDEAAIVVVILWNRLGTPTGQAASGTTEEYERAVAHQAANGWPIVMPYFCQRPSAPLIDKDAIDQRTGVLTFQSKYPQLAKTYSSVDEFCRSLRKDLAEAVEEAVAALAASEGSLSQYRKVLYVLVTHLRTEKAGDPPAYRRTIDRLPAGEQQVDVYDEAVYYTLERFPETQKVPRRHEESNGAIDPRLVIPWMHPMVYGDANSGRARGAVQVESHDATDTMLTVSHFVNGLQHAQEDFTSRIEYDAEYARLVVDFSSIADAASRVRPARALLRRAGQDAPLAVSTVGESTYMIECTPARAGDYLVLYVTIDRRPVTA